jgi:hypothetical protein
MVEPKRSLPRKAGKEEEPVTDQMTSGTLDFGALRRAIEGRDAEALVGFYADDAQMVTVN